MRELSTHAPDVKIAYDALRTAQSMAGAIERLLVEIDAHATPDTYPLACAMEACLEKMGSEVGEALLTLEGVRAVAGEPR